MNDENQRQININFNDHEHDLLSSNYKCQQYLPTALVKHLGLDFQEINNR